MQNYRQLFDLNGKIAVVLGAASGIGQASAHALGDLGAHVVCADRDSEGARATSHEITGRGGSAEWMPADAASGSDIAALADHTLAAHGRVDIAVATPALNIRKLIVDYTDDEFDQVLSLIHI